MGSYAKPVFIDIDNDGDHDLFIGNSSGKIYCYRNDGDASNPIWTFVTDNYNSIDVGSYAKPAFIDIDNDGDYDLFIGNFSGQIYYYGNDGDASNPSWVYITDNYNSIVVGDRATPTFADINNDGDQDLFVGTRGGGISQWRHITYSISGNVSDGGSGLSGVEISVTNSSVMNGKTTTDSSGNFSFSLLEGGDDFYISPYDIHYVFSPSGRNYSNLSGNTTGADFAATLKYIIGGTITDGTNPVSGITVDISGDSTGSTITGSDGKYQFIHLDSGGTYYITPTKTYYTLIPDSKEFTNLNEDHTSTDFAAILNQWSISGTITDGTNPLPNITVNLLKEWNPFISTTTNDSGVYSFSNVDAGSTYTVEPIAINYTFSSTSVTFYNFNSNKTFDFTGTLKQWTISGTITDGTNGLSRVTVNLTGDSTATTITDTNGNYSFTNLDAGKNYSVTPALSNYTFNPVNSAFTDLSQDETADFTGNLNQWSISGSIMAGSTPLASVQVAISKDGEQLVETTTDGSGSYTFTNLDAGSTYVITPILTHYTFSPQSNTIVDLGGNETVDFSGSLDQWTISGTITDGTSGLSGVTVNLTGDSTATSITDTNGNYSFTNLDAGKNYSVTPALLNYTFNPGNLTFTDLSQDETTDFTGNLNQWSISGIITDGNEPISGVTVNLTGDSTATTITDISGSYSFSNLNAGATYTITPSKANITFIPANLTYTDLGDDITDANFKGTVPDLSHVIAYPNPFKKGEGVDFITFYNLTPNANIKIYTITGRCIFEVQTDGIEYRWNMTDRDEDRISVGIYIYYITNENGDKKTGKLAIVK